ncbi:AgmX/PglI C-terminal domain-containing protein [Bdellovibrio sp. GT3]|uniref:AgmX/PglI C-terminal domain-containing protein n=1 Tax=Bdellovibrio sp. GT3 TaxID=3136282 RepID=UPI0030F04CE3
MNAAKLIILENIAGQKVRTFAVDSESLNIVYLKDTRRVEALADLSVLKNNDIEYSLIKKINLGKMNEQGEILQGLGRVRLATFEDINSPVHTLQEENDEEQLKTILTRTTVGHLVLVGLIMMGAWVMATYFTKKDEAPLVTIVLPKQETQKVVQQKAPHVKVSEKKIKPSNKVYKPVVKKQPLKVKKYTTNTAKARNVQRVGALAALGGTPKGTRGYEGLDNNSMKAIRSAGIGNGGGGVGSAGRGGVKGFLPGNGLIAGSAGEGGRAQSAGGYGTRGVGGGRAGYGKMNMVGGTSASSLPLDAEATVEGGLDLDQIIAVINRNKGQILYCYEKGLQAQPAIGGRVAVDFVIGPNGRISTARVSQTSLNSRLVEDCMIAKMKNWQFPKPVGKVNVDVNYPFELMRVSAR